MVFLIFSYFFKKSISLILGFVFLVHPINSEVALYISNTQDALYFFFGIVSFWFLIKCHSKKYLILIPFGLLLALLSKETAVLFLVILLLYSFLFNRKKLTVLVGASITTAVIYLILRFHAVGFIHNVVNAPIGKISFGGRLLMVPDMFLYYLKTFLFPIYLASSYHWVHTQVSINNFFIPLAIDMIFILFLFSFGVTLCKKHYDRHINIYFFFCIWFFIGIVFHLQIFPLDMTVAERWFYFPIVGLLGIIGIFLEIIGKKLNKSWRIEIVFIILLLLSVRTFVRTYNWRNMYSLTGHDIQISKDDYNLENERGAELLKLGRYEESKSYLTASIKHFPYMTNYFNLGNLYVNLKDYNNAKNAYQHALQFGDYYITYESLGSLTLVSGDTKENVQFLESSLNKYPQSGKLWLYLAIIEYKSGNGDQAREAVKNAYRLNPDNQTRFVYEKIINNQPLILNLKAEK
jgi:protein O-mannosyl-transferase